MAEGTIRFAFKVAAAVGTVALAVGLAA